MKRRRSGEAEPLDVWWEGEAPVDPRSGRVPVTPEPAHPPRRRRGQHAPTHHPAPPPSRPGLPRRPTARRETSPTRWSDDPPAPDDLRLGQAFDGHDDRTSAGPGPAVADGPVDHLAFGETPGPFAAALGRIDDALTTRPPSGRRPRALDDADDRTANGRVGPHPGTIDDLDHRRTTGPTPARYPDALDDRSSAGPTSPRYPDTLDDRSSAGPASARYPNALGDRRTTGPTPARYPNSLDDRYAGGPASGGFEGLGDIPEPGEEWGRRTAQRRRSEERRAEAAQTPTRPERRAVVAGRAVGGALVGVAALGAAWLVLVLARRQPRLAYDDPIAAALDAAIAESLAADHLLAVATWVGYVTTTIVVGGLAVGALLAPRRRSLPLGPVVACGLAAALASVPLRATTVSGGTWSAVTDVEVARHVATSSFGGAIALRVAGLLMVAATLAGGRAADRGRPDPGRRHQRARGRDDPAPDGRTDGRRPWGRIVGRALGGGVLVASYLVIGHAQATDPVVVEVTALAVHVLAAATWFGGVVVLGRALDPRSRWGRLPAEAVARFSRMAEVMVVLVLVSGLVLAEGQGVLSTAPWASAYGRAFTAKLVFVGVVLAVGGWNRQRAVPAVTGRDDAAARRHLRSTCVLEAMVIGMGVLLMTAAMTSGGL